MKIDGRLSKQSIRNAWSPSREIYVWKHSKNNYSVGINGTSLHFGNLEKWQAETKATELVLARI